MKKILSTKFIKKAQSIVCLACNLKNKNSIVWGLVF